MILQSRLALEKTKDGNAKGVPDNPVENTSVECGRSIKALDESSHYSRPEFFAQSSVSRYME